jgi:hypothetical protein
VDQQNDFVVTHGTPCGFFRRRGKATCSVGRSVARQSRRL